MITKRTKCFLGGYDIYAAEDKRKPMVKIGHVRKRAQAWGGPKKWMYSYPGHPREESVPSLQKGIDTLVALALLAK